MMKTIFQGLLGVFVFLGLELLIWGMIVGQRNLITIGIINILLGGALLAVQYKRHLPYIPHFHKYIKQYGYAILVVLLLWYVLKSVLLGSGLEHASIILAGIIGISIYFHEFPRIQRGRQGLSVWRLLGIISLIVVLLIFQKHRAIDTPWLIVTACSAGWLVYAIGMAITDGKLLHDPLLITWGCITIVATIRASTVVLIDAYKERQIETIVYQEKEIYLPAEACLPDWGNIKSIQK